ncbi:MAG: hypothetical protein JXC31_02515 [Acholeplasmataceae bacterium]|nr:hypothetical protein [Acholeplasmataceae bacterium]
MRKLLTVFVLFMTVFAFTGCNNDDGQLPDRIKIEDMCGGSGEYFVINGVCVLKEDILSDSITINGEETIVDYMDSIELMDSFVADLSDSTGLAVVPRDVFEAQTLSNKGQMTDLMLMASELDVDQETANLLVKLTEEGFFEEVGFTDEQGHDVTIMSNPLALEIFGAYTIVVFEVDLGYENTGDFTQRVFDSLYAGGIYLIHNESGKMFATKDIEYTENTYSYTEDHSRNVQLTVTLNEPVIEVQHIPRVEDGMPVLDEEGNQIIDEVLVPVLDDEGNPLIFTEGPMLTEFQDVPLVEYYKVQQVDDEGNLVFDENNEPVYDIVEEPILDENGDPVVENKEFPVLDDEGNPVYQTEFQVDLFIEDIRTITVTEYYATVTNNPLSGVAQRFVDQIIAEYYNWNYYRVNNYIISSWGFSASDEDIFFMENKQSTTDPSKYENYVIKLSFDSENNELLLEDYLNATKAGFVNCEIILDPRNNNIICDTWDNNIKVYSQTEGLKTIPDSANLNPVTFPNGDLYFYDYREEYVEELGYYTALLYVINSDGTLSSSYIELGEREQVCYDNCYNYINFDMYDMEGNPYNEQGYNNASVMRSDGDLLISNSDLHITEIGEFDSTRPECTDAYGCYATVNYGIYDGEELIVKFDEWLTYYPGDVAPAYQENYDIDMNTQVEYQQEWSDDDKLCENGEVGCIDNYNFVDESLNSYGLWFYTNQIISEGENFLDRIVLAEDNNAIYEYTKEINGTVCQDATCYKDVQVRIYDDEGEKIAESMTYIEYNQGDTIPVYIEYRMTENTETTEKSNHCAYEYGCWENYETFDNVYYGISYQFGDTMYDTIVFAETDKSTFTEETLTSSMCMDPYGCYVDEVIYIIEDDLGNIVYEFNEYAYVEYGYRAPFKVTATLSDITIFNEKVSTQEIALCDDPTCHTSVEIVRSDGSQGWDYIGWANITFVEGEQLISRIILGEDQEPTSVVDHQVCNLDEGCIQYTNNFTILDEEGNELQIEDQMYYSLPVYFAKGENLPVDSNFDVTFTMSNTEYIMSRLNVYDFINNLNDVVILDTNLYLIERSSWTQGQDNVILTYDEINNRYLAMYTNLSAVTEITKLGDSYVAINDDETAIYKFEYNVELSDNNYYYFDVANMTEGLQINGVNDLIIDYDGSIYFKGIDNFIHDITGSISETGVVTIDTSYVEHEIIRMRPIN